MKKDVYKDGHKLRATTEITHQMVDHAAIDTKKIVVQELVLSVLNKLDTNQIAKLFKIYSHPGRIDTDIYTIEVSLAVRDSAIQLLEEMVDFMKTGTGHADMLYNRAVCLKKMLMTVPIIDLRKDSVEDIVGHFRLEDEYVHIDLFNEWMSTKGFIARKYSDDLFDYTYHPHTGGNVVYMPGKYVIDRHGIEEIVKMLKDRFVYL